MALKTRLLKTIALLYRMESADIKDLEKRLMEAREEAYQDALEWHAQRHGCPGQNAKPPKGASRRELRRLSRSDSRSIARTWNATIEREITRLFNTNRRGNRNYYTRNLEIFARQRNTWKTIQIAMMAESTARQLALEDFIANNDLSNQRYVYQGPAPVSDTCIMRTAAGVVSARFVKREPVPAHPNCPHNWEPVGAALRDCATIWVG